MEDSNSRTFKGLEFLFKIQGRSRTSKDPMNPVKNANKIYKNIVNKTFIILKHDYYPAQCRNQMHNQFHICDAKHTTTCTCQCYHLDSALS